MKYLKLYENFDEFRLENFISISKITKIFNKYGLACDNESHFTEIDINNYELTIYCMYSSYDMDGKIPKNISNILNKICEELGADEWDFGNFYNTVVFSFDEKRIKAIDKYNL